MWSGAEGWLNALTRVLDTPEGESARAAARVRRDTVLDVAAVDARAANSRTGRELATAHATVAGILGCSPKTVQRVRTLIEKLGFARTVARGRYLTNAERQAAREAHGGRQIRVASERALIVPPGMNVHLPRRGQLPTHSSVTRNVPRRAQARTGAAPRPAPSTRKDQPRPTLAVQRLAAGLAQRCPWLAPGHIGSLCHTLTSLGLDTSGWTAGDLIDLLDRRNATNGLFSIHASKQRRPLALLAHQLRDALSNVGEPPQQRRLREAAERAAARERQRAQEEARKAHLARPEVQAAISQSRAELRAILAEQKRRNLYAST